MSSLRGTLRSLIPESTRRSVRRGLTRILRYGSQRYCPVCGARTKSFRAHGIPPAPDAVCHVCLSKAPHRLASLFFRQFETQLFQRGQDCVHVAPEPELSRQLAGQCTRTGMRYRPGGYGERYPEFFDLTNLALPDQSVSLFYCCHVLNALVEDRKAMSEVFRTLAPQGVAVLQVPAFCTEATTVEALESNEQRLAAFRDPLIYRCYTDADYRARLQTVGFHVESFEAVSFPNAERIKMGLHQEVLHVGFRDPQHPVALALQELRHRG